MLLAPTRLILKLNVSRLSLAACSSLTPILECWVFFWKVNYYFFISISIPNATNKQTGQSVSCWVSRNKLIPICLVAAITQAVREGLFCNQYKITVAVPLWEEAVSVRWSESSLTPGGSQKLFGKHQ